MLQLISDPGGKHWLPCQGVGRRASIAEQVSQFLSLFILKRVIQNCFTSEELASGYIFTSEDQNLFQAMWRLLTEVGPWSGEVIWKIRWEITVWGGYMENKVENERRSPLMLFKG